VVALANRDAPTFEALLDAVIADRELFYATLRAMVDYQLRLIAHATLPSLLNALVQPEDRRS
jgi:hypothetical protein